MALNTTYAPVREAGNGSKVDFDFDFEVLSASDLSVGKILNSTNVKTDMVLGVDFTVTLNTVTRKGTVHYTVAPTTLQDSWIGRAVPVTQPTDIPTNNIFREVQVENALDRQAMISQQLEEKIGRALLLPDTSDLSDLSLPTPEAGKALKWNATEDGFENSTYDTDIVGDYAAAAGASATAAAQSASDAGDSADAAGASAIAAAASAASINLPTLASGDASKILQVKADESGYELKTVSSVMGFVFPGVFQRDARAAVKTPFSTAANRYAILTPSKMAVDINGLLYVLSSQVEISLAVAANWDTVSPTNYTVAANRAGKDFYLYACVPMGGYTPTLVLSAASTYPSGYTASNSRKIGGFHCLCVSVGTISGHTLTGFVAGDVLPASIWDLNHKPKNANPEGMVYSSGIDLWVDIYLASGTGSSTASVYNATASDTRNWMDYVDDGGAVNKRMLTDPEFQVIATGSNEETNISGSADPGTTGGKSDTASRRMISNIGCEDCCGNLWQWLDEQTMMYDSAVTAAWYDLPGSKGSRYRPIYSNDVKLLAGGAWDNATHCGSRSRDAASYRWYTNSTLGCRFCAEPV